MADINSYKIETAEELTEKINEEIEVLDSIFEGEGIVLLAPTPCDVQEPDQWSTNSSGGDGDDNVPISEFMAKIELTIKPNTGFDEAKIGMLLHCTISFDQYYPYRSPHI